MHWGRKGGVYLHWEGKKRVCRLRGRINTYKQNTTVHGHGVTVRMRIYAKALYLEEPNVEVQCDEAAVGVDDGTDTLLSRAPDGVRHVAIGAGHELTVGILENAQLVLVSDE